MSIPVEEKGLALSWSLYFGRFPIKGAFGFTNCWQRFVMFMLLIDNFSFSVSILKSLFNENVGRLNQDFPKDNCLKVWYLLALQRFQLRPVTDSFCQPLNHKRPELITINYFFLSEIIFREKMVSLSNNDIFDNDKTFLRNVWHFSVITRINYVSIFLYLS